MRKIHSLASLIVLLILGTMTAISQAGDLPGGDISLVTADCDAVTVSYVGGFNETVEIVASTPTSSTVNPDPFLDSVPPLSEDTLSGTATFTFTPSLPDGTVVTVEAYFGFNIQPPPPGPLPLGKQVRDGVKSKAPVVQGEPIGAFDSLTVTVRCDEPTTETGELIVGCNDERLNQSLCEPIAIYTVESDDGIGMTVWNVDRGDDIGFQELYIAAEDLAAALAAETDTTCVLEASSDGDTVVYLLPDGSLQASYGPDAEGKIFNFIFETYPGSPSITTQFGTALPTSPSC